MISKIVFVHFMFIQASGLRSNKIYPTNNRSDVFYNLFYWDQGIKHSLFQKISSLDSCEIKKLFILKLRQLISEKCSLSTTESNQSFCIQNKNLNRLEWKVQIIKKLNNSLKTFNPCFDLCIW